MKPIPGRIRRWAAAAVTALAAAGAPCSAQTRSPSLFAAELVREALAVAGVTPEMRIVPRTAKEMHQLVSSRLDPRLLLRLQRVSGSDFRYRLPGRDLTTHFGTIVLRYPAPEVARRMASLPSLRRSYFRNSTILIRYAVVPLGNLLVVAYSENSGDRRIVAALNSLPARFEKAVSQSPIHWDEPDDTTSRPAQD